MTYVCSYNFTLNAEFNGASFKAHRMRILFLELCKYIYEYLTTYVGVICAHMVDFAGPVTNLFGMKHKAQFVSSTDPVNMDSLYKTLK